MKRTTLFCRCYLPALITALCSAAFPEAARAQVLNVWALGDGEKVYREDLAHPDKSGNAVWDGKTLRLKGLYNEILAFQLIVETGKDSARGIDISLDLPLHKVSGKVIGGNTLQYGPSGAVEIFTEHYLLVKDSTPPDWHYGSPAAFKNRKMTGWIPDALIPADAKPGKGGLPIDVGPLRNQGFWVDIHLPRDQKNFPKGLYKGNVQVLHNGKAIANIPLEITLLPQYLTDENPANVWLYSSDMYPYFPELSHQQVDKLVKFEGRRHRIDVVGGFGVNNRPFDRQNMDQYKSFLDGTAFTPSNGYHGNGQGVGEKLFPVGMYSAPVLGATREEMQAQSNLWVDWFKKNAPDVKYFWYIIDEPRKDKHAWIKERSGWIKANPGPGKELPVFTTTHYQPELDGFIDIWAAFDGVNLEDLAAARKNGGDHWFYNGNRPRIGSIILEGAATDFRVDSWILYKYGIKTWFIWHGTQWRHNLQGPKRHLHQNVFQNPLTFINEHLEMANGEGVILYPGRMPFYKEEDRGLNKLLPSIRLKNIRRGQQDAAIMLMAERKSGKQKVLNIVNKIVPKALSEVSMQDEVQWSQKGDDYDFAREELLKLL